MLNEYMQFFNCMQMVLVPFSCEVANGKTIFKTGQRRFSNSISSVGFHIH